MGRSERFACEAFVEGIIEHLLKLEHSARTEAAAHWRKELRNFRYELGRRTTPSIERGLRQTLAGRYEKGRGDAADLGNDEPGFAERLPTTCPYSFEQIAGDWLPAARD